MRIGRVDNDDIEAAVGLGDVFCAVVDDGFEALVGKDRPGEFGEMFLGEFDHLGVDLDLGEAFDRLVLEHFLGDAAVAAADDEDVARIAVGEQRHMRHHLLVDEFVLLGDLGGAIEHQHLAEKRLLEQHQMLVLGLHFVEHLVDLKGHAETEIVEQRLGNPALLRHRPLPYEKRPGLGPAAHYSFQARRAQAS